jgi:putative ABC transport system ATP-binding protein
MEDRRDTFPDKLSGGEQQRVAIARALVHDPMLVLADEPTGNLDENTGEQVLDLLLALTRRRGKTLIMATHNPEIARMADRIVRVHDGRLQDETQLQFVEYA